MTGFGLLVDFHWGGSATNRVIPSLLKLNSIDNIAKQYVFLNTILIVCVCLCGHAHKISDLHIL